MPRSPRTCQCRSRRRRDEARILNLQRSNDDVVAPPISLGAILITVPDRRSNWGTALRFAGQRVALAFGIFLAFYYLYRTELGYPARLLGLAFAVPVIVGLLKAGSAKGTRFLLLLGPLPLFASGVGLDLRIPLIFMLLSMLAAEGLPAPVAHLRILAPLAMAVLLATASAGLSQSTLIAAAEQAALFGWVVLVSVSVRQRGLEAVVSDIAVGGVFIGLIGLAEYLFKFDLPGALNSATTVIDVSRAVTSARFGGPLGDYELFGTYLSLVGVCQFYFMTRTQSLSGASRLLWPVAFALTALLELETGTRASSATLVLGVLGLMVLRVSTGGAWFGAARRAVYAGLVLSPVLLTVGSSSQLFFRFTQLSNTTSVQGALDRSQVWALFSARAGEGWLRWVGQGPAYPYQSFGFFPHSLWLYTGYTTGVLGVMALGAVLIVATTRVVFALRRADHDRPMLGLCLILLVIQLSDTVIIEAVRYTATAVLFWTVMAFALSAGQRPVNGEVPGPDHGRHLGPAGGLR